MTNLFFHVARPLAEMLGLIRPSEYQRRDAEGETFWVPCNNRLENGACAGHIQATETIERNADGSFFHPDIPDFSETDDTLEQWIQRQGLEIHIEHANWQGHTVDLSKWTPTKPATKGNWFLLVLIDTDDGPVAWWANPIF